MSSRSRGDNHDVFTPQYHRYDIFLERSEFSPTETVDDVVLQAGMKEIKSSHKKTPHVSAISSTLVAEAAWRSVAVSSVSWMVSL